MNKGDLLYRAWEDYDFCSFKARVGIDVFYISTININGVYLKYMDKDLRQLPAIKVFPNLAVKFSYATTRQGAYKKLISSHKNNQKTFLAHVKENIPSNDVELKDNEDIIRSYEDTLRALDRVYKSERTKARNKKSKK